MANESIESIGQINGSVDQNGNINIESNNLIDGSWIDGVELNDENTGRIAGKMKDAMGGYYEQLIDKVSTLVTLLGGKEQPDGSVDTSDAEEKAENESDEPEKIEVDDSSIEELGEGIKNSMFGEQTDLTKDFALTNKTSGVTPNDLTNIPLGIGSGFVLLYETMKSILDEMKKSSEPKEEDEGEKSAKLSFKDLMGDIGTSMAALAVGLVGFSVALLALQAVDASTLGLAALVVAGLGGIVYAMVRLAQYVKDQGVDEQLEIVNKTVGTLGLTLMEMTASVAIGAFAINTFGYAAVFSGLVLTFGITLAAIGGTIFLSNYIKQSVSEDTFKSITDATKNIATTMILMSVSLITATIAGMLIWTIGPQYAIAPLLVTVGIIYGFMRVSQSLENGGDKAIKAVGEAMVNVAISMILISAALLISGLVGEWLLNGGADITTVQRVIGIMAVLGISYFMLKQLEKIGNSSNPAAILAVGVAMVLVSASMILTSVALLIAGSIGEWLLSDPLRTIGMVVVIGSMIGLMVGLNALGQASQSMIGNILLGLVGIGASTLALLMIGGAYKLIAEVIEMAGGGVEGALTLVASVGIMIGGMAVMMVALAGLGMLMAMPLVAAGIAAGIIAAAVLSSALLIVGNGYQAIGEAMNSIGDDVSASVEKAVSMVRSLAQIGTALAWFGVTSLVFLNTLPYASIVLIAMTPIVTLFAEASKQVSDVADTIGDEAVQKCQKASAAILSLSLVAVTLGLFGIATQALSTSISWASTNVLTLYETMEKVRDTALLAQSISDLGIDLSTIGQVGRVALDLTALAGVLGLLGIALSLMQPMLENAAGGFVTLNEATKSIEETSQHLASIEALGIDTTINSLADQIDNIHFGLGTALKLRSALASLQYAFGGNVNGDMSSTMDAVAKSVEALSSIEKVADGFERLAALSEPLNEVAVSMREVASAAREIADANIPEALEGLQSMKQPEEEEKPQALEQPKEDDGQAEKLDQLIQLTQNMLNAINASSSSMARMANVANTSSGGEDQITQALKNAKA